MKKRLLSILLALCLMLTLLPGTAWAEEGATSGICGDNLTWSFSNGTLTISGSGPMYDWEHGYAIPWHQLRNDITSVVISDGVTSIRERAFEGCSSLTNIAMPNNITSIAYCMFFGCSSLTSIAIPDSVTSIEGHAFCGCSSLTSITIPDGVTSIGPSAFGGCSSLTSITIPDSVTSIESSAFLGCSSLTSIAIPDGVTCIERCAFEDCSSLTSITIPDGVTSIEQYAFSGCSSLTNINIPDSVMSIGDRTFFACSSLTSINIPDGVTSIEDGTFSGCSSLTSIAIPDSVTSIGWGAFEGCNNLTSIAIPDGVTNIGSSAFEGCSSLTSVTIPNSVTSIGNNAFYKCSSLTSINIPDSVTKIGMRAFVDCSSLTSIAIPDGVMGIGDRTFFACSSLTSVTIPNSVTYIGRYAFSSCFSLTDVYYAGSEEDWQKIYIQGGYNGLLLSATIHYNSTGAGEDPKPWDQYKVYRNGGYEGFDISLEECMAKTASTAYNPQLAHILISMCNSVYSPDDMRNTFKSFGFKQGDWFFAQGPYLNYAIAQKQLSGDETLVLVAVRGTGEFSEDLTEWLSNAHITTNDRNQHQGFSDATNDLHDTIMVGLKKNGENVNLQKVKFVITGFSRGAAVSNLLAERLLRDGASKDRLYAYAFACPDTVKSAADLLTGYERIFNISDVNDLVSWVPDSLWFFSDNWNKYGRSYWFCKDWNDYENLKMVDLATLGDAHSQVKYMDYLRSEKSTSEYRTRLAAKSALDQAGEWRLRQNLLEQPNVGGRRFPYLRAHCPVDLEIYSADGVLVGSVINNVENIISNESIHIYVDGDQKNVFFLDDGEYTIKFAGTDNGVMTYSVQNVDVDTWTFSNEKIFENVALTSSKKLVSHIYVNNEADTQKVQLFVLNNDGEPEKEVLPDGKGTEVPIKTPVDPPASCEHEYTVTVTPPTCTERGYTTHTCGKCNDSYVDSYTAALGHNYGAWAIVVPATTTTNGRQERVCSRCGDKQTEAIPATGGSETNTPDYGFGGGGGSSSSPTTYKITISSVAGGIVSVSPKSAAKGTVVTISAVPDTDYELISITALDNNGNAIVLTDKGNGKYTFTMPSGKATVNAVFQPIQPNTPEPDTPVESVWSNPYIDVVGGAWYYDAVEFVSTNGLMNGTSNSIFEPDAPLSRAMLAQILYNKEGRPTVASSVFTDVANNAWYADAVAWAATQGIVGGYGNGLFGPDDNITREQLAVMLWRYAGKPAATSQELYFNDADTANGYAVDALCWAVEQGIINGHGNGQLGPQELATRAQVAQIFMNYLKK